MIVFLNGQFMPEEEAMVSIFDRAFLYGDGLFEAVRVFNGQYFRWDAHFERLEGGARFLRIRLPYAAAQLREFAEELIAKNSITDSLLRIALSRGVGPRGYSPKGADHPTLAMSLHSIPTCSPATPVGWKLRTSSFRLPAGEALAQFKNCNKLPQALARAEAEAAGADEALLLNTNGQVVESSCANLFWIEGQTVCTAPLESGILAGVTRIVVEEICAKAGIRFHLGTVTPDQLLRAQGVFLSLSSLGIVEGTSLNGQTLEKSPLVSRINSDYWALVRAETGAH
jgi:branched-chain amino acid aminotransferase